MNSIVIYASKSGVTEALAQRAAKDLDCDIIKIEPLSDYSNNYFQAVAKVGFEKITGKKATYANILPDLSDYDMVIFGYPIWYSAPPAYAIDFIHNCNLDGKIVVPISTSGATPITATLNKVKKACGNAKVLYPLNFSMVSKDNYDEWLKIMKAM